MLKNFILLNSFLLTACAAGTPEPDYAHENADRYAPHVTIVNYQHSDDDSDDVIAADVYAIDGIKIERDKLEHEITAPPGKHNLILHVVESGDHNYANKFANLDLDFRNGEVYKIKAEHDKQNAYTWLVDHTDKELTEKLLATIE